MKSKLEKLIDELCPDGVEYKKICEISLVTIGEFVHKSRQNEKSPYPVFNGGINNTGFYDEYNRTANKIIISARGANAGFVNRVFTNYWSGNSCYTIEVNDRNVNWNYIYYYLKNKERKLLGEQQKGGIPAVSKRQVEDFQIPLPPLPVQEEIVRILDTFTELTAELTAELTMRKQQYEYYRDSLLTFGEEVAFLKLKEVAQYSKDRINATDIDETTYIGVDNLLQNRQGKTNSNYVPTEGRLTRYEKNNILIGNIRPYLKKIWFSNVYGGTNGDVLVIQPTVKNLLPKYLYTLLCTDKFFDFNMQNAKGAKMPRGNKEAIMNYLIPLPPLEEQQRIVDILDRFDTLTNDIKTGLPAEIELRKKQYEYYRDKLLTFKKLEKESL